MARISPMANESQNTLGVCFGLEHFWELTGSLEKEFPVFKMRWRNMNSLGSYQVLKAIPLKFYKQFWDSHTLRNDDTSESSACLERRDPHDHFDSIKNGKEQPKAETTHFSLLWSGSLELSGKEAHKLHVQGEI